MRVFPAYSNSFALVIPADHRIESAAADSEVTDDELLPLVDAHLPPRAPTLTRLIATVQPFGYKPSSPCAFTARIRSGKLAFGAGDTRIGPPVWQARSAIRAPAASEWHGGDMVTG
jgi:hypothetical protein